MQTDPINDAIRDEFQGVSELGVVAVREYVVTATLIDLETGTSSVVTLNSNDLLNSQALALTSYAHLRATEIVRREIAASL